MRLAHFTRIFSLAGIVREGISKGEVAISPVYVINFPWFTSEFSQEAQVDWVSYTSDKTALRLEVEFGEQDDRLVLWRDYAKRLGVREDWYRSLTAPNLKRNERSWRVYRGVVPFDWIKGAYFHPLRERLTPDDLRQAAELVAPLYVQSVNPPCRHLTETEALALSHDEWMAGNSRPVFAAMADVAQHFRLTVVNVPVAHTFLDYVRNAVEAYRQALSARFVRN